MSKESWNTTNDGLGKKPIKNIQISRIKVNPLEGNTNIQAVLLLIILNIIGIRRNFKGWKEKKNFPQEGLNQALLPSENSQVIH